jgi:serine/threonine protein kinase
MLKEDDYKENEKIVDLISQMLHLDPKKRISAVDALKHEYMMEYVEDCSTDAFRQGYVRDWMALKKGLVHSNSGDEARKKKESAKRKAMLLATAAVASGAAEVDDLYDMDDMLEPKAEKRAKLEY